MSEADVQRAALALEAGRPEDALRLIGRHLAQFPDDAAANCVASEALRMLGRGQEALAAAMNAVRASPADRGTWRSLAFAQRGVGDLPHAVDSARRAVELAPADWGAHVDLAVIAGETNPWSPVAIQAAQEAVRLAPDQSLTHHAMAVGMLRRNQTKQAMKSFRTALRLDPQSESARHDMALAAMHSGNPAGATVELAGLTALSPTNKLSYENFRIAIGKTFEQIHLVALAGAMIPLLLQKNLDRLLVAVFTVATLAVMAFLVMRTRRALGASLTPVVRFVLARDRLIAVWAVVDAVAVIPLVASPLLPSPAWPLSYEAAFVLLVAGSIIWFIRGRRMFVEAKKR